MATLKEEYSRLGDAMEKTQGSAMQARPHGNISTRGSDLGAVLTSAPEVITSSDSHLLYRSHRRVLVC